MNISQHSIIPIGYPVLQGYYSSAGGYRPSPSNRSIDVTRLMGCTSVFNCMLRPDNLLYLRCSNIHPSQEGPAVTVSLDSTLVTSVPQRRYFTVLSISSSFYYSCLYFPFLIFFKTLSNSLSYRTLIQTDLVI